MVGQRHDVVASTSPKEVPHAGRLAVVRRHDPAVASLVEQLLAVAPRGLAAAHLGAGRGFAQTLRGSDLPGARGVGAEGRNPRYAAMAALGLSRLPAPAQQHVLSGSTLDALLGGIRSQATGGEPGALALALWADAEVAGHLSTEGLSTLHRLVRSEAPMPTVAVAWAVTAGVAAAGLGDTAGLVSDGCERLLRHRGEHGIFPHTLSAGRHGLRGHVASFADQVYPLQALARAASHTGDATLLATADRTAALLCHHQGAAGQWAWHYDTRTGDVVERYPVYSVHQHAMAPMVLFDLADAGGTDHGEAITRGLGWLLRHPEVEEDLVDADLGVVWRKVGRRERAKASRVAAGVTTAIRPGWHLPGVDRLLPPTWVDHECRPYELGWLLYTWLTPTPGRASGATSAAGVRAP